MKMELYDQGHKQEISESPVATNSKENTVSYPHLTLNSYKFPEVKNWEVGKQYHVHLVLEQIGIRESYNHKDEYEAEFDVIKAGSMGNAKVDKDEYDKMSDDEKDKIDEKEIMDDEVADNG